MLKSVDINWTLREFTPEDALPMSQIANNPLIACNLRDGFPSPYTLDHARDWLAMVLTNKHNLLRAIDIDGRLAGSVGLHAGHDVYRFNYELGYWLGEPYWGKGIMTAVVKEMVKKGFSELKAHRIFAGIFDFNNASAAVLLKCGFRHEATLHQSVYKNNQWADELIFSMLETDYTEST